jgi:GntR family transcriptional regulator
MKIMQVKEDKSYPLFSKPNHKTLTESTITALLNAINQEKFKPGSKLPSEFELMEMLGVSRTTLREALRSLEEHGVIIRKRGVGTFITGNSIIKDLSINFGIKEMIAQAGYIPKTVECEVLEEKAQGKIADNLEIEEGELVYLVKRLRLATDFPIVWSIEALPAKLLNYQIPSQNDLKEMSIYDYLEINHGIQIYYGRAILRPITAPIDVARKLQIRHNSILMLINQTDYGEKQQPVIYSIEYHLADKVTFLIHRKGPHR